MRSRARAAPRTATITGTTDALIRPSTAPAGFVPLVVTGATRVAATSKNTATAKLEGGSGNVVGVNVFFADAAIGTEGGDTGTRAYLDTGVNLTTGTLDVTATSADTAKSDALSVLVSLAAGGQGGRSKAFVSTETAAYMGRGPVAGTTTVVTAMGNAQPGGAPSGKVTATATASPIATANGVSGGGAVGVVVQAFDAEATIEGKVAAGIANTTVRSGALDVKATAPAANAVATTRVDGGAVGVNVGAGEAFSQNDFEVEARLANARIEAEGQVQVHAVLVRGRAESTANNAGGAAVTVGTLGGEAKMGGTTKAIVDIGTDVVRAAGLDVFADSTTEAKATVNVVSGGVITVRVTTADAETTAKATASLGNQVDVGNFDDPNNPLPIDGDVSVKARLRTEADSIGFAPGGGGISVGVPQAEATFDPTVEASIGVGSGPRSTRVHTAGNITVESRLTTEGGIRRSAPPTPSTCSTSTRTRSSFTYSSIGTGDVVQYSAPNGAAARPAQRRRLHGDRDRDHRRDPARFGLRADCRRRRTRDDHVRQRASVPAR